MPATLLRSLRDTGMVWLSMFVLGSGLGIMVAGSGLPWWVAPLLSGTIYAGSVEFLLVGLLTAAAPLSAIALTTALVNSRHLFYGLAFPLQRVHGLARLYSIFALTDEAFALAATRDVAPPAANEVQIRVKALGINRAEIMYRNGEYVIDPAFPAKLGYEAAGDVSAVGSNVTGIKQGDRVSVIPSFSFADYGMYGELVNVPMHAVVKIPENISYEQAAATWMKFVTAFGALVLLGQMTAGDTVVLGASTSSVGLAAIQLAKKVGAIPVALTRCIDAFSGHRRATERYGSRPRVCQQ